MLAFFLTRNFNFCQSENFVSPFPLSLPIPSVFLLHFYSDVAQYGCHRLLLSIEYKSSCFVSDSLAIFITVANISFGSFSLCLLVLLQACMIIP